MKYDPLQARVMLVDGPVAVFLHQAPQTELRAALMRLQAVINVAVIELETAYEQEQRNDPARTQR